MLMMVAILIASAGGQGESAAARFPSRTIENIFPWGPGGALSASQIVASAMGEEIGRSVVVVSNPGAAGTRAFQTAMNRPADGYTIIDGYVAPLVLQPVLGNADWSYRDFKPLHAVVANAFSIAGRADETRWSDFEGLMEYGRNNPGKLRYTSHSRNNLPHMVIAKVLQSYGVVAQHVPYEEAEANKDLVAGVLDFAFVGVAGYLQDPESFDILLVLSDHPAAAAAYGGAPTIADLDIDLELEDLGPMGWTWWLVHPDTPDHQTQVLRDAMERTMARQDVRESLERIGFIPLDWGPEDYHDIVGSVYRQLSSMQDALAWEREEMSKLQ